MDNFSIKLYEILKCLLKLHIKISILSSFLSKAENGKSFQVHWSELFTNLHTKPKLEVLA